MSSLEAERTLFEFTHPEVGEMVAERWDLPARYVAAIAHHHHPQAAGEERTFCALIGLADQAAYAALGGETPPAEHDSERVALLELLSLRPQHWDECLQHLHDAHTDINGFVGAIR